MKNILLCSLLIFLLVSSCKKFTEPGEPKTQLTSSTVFSSDATAVAAQLAIYAQMEARGLFYNISVATALSGDEMINYQTLPDRVDLYSNNLRPENIYTVALWNQFYDLIFKANAVYQALPESKGVSDPVKKQLSGEALFVRAFCHFYLAQLFGDIPVITTTDFRQNAIASRQPIELVLKQIQDDLLNAGELLSVDYLNVSNRPTIERTRPNAYAAKALLARVYLYSRNWASATEAATTLIDLQSKYDLLTDLNAIFLKNSKEAIWQLEAIVPEFNTYAGAIFPFSALPANVSLSAGFINNFDTADLRYSNWVKPITVGGNKYYYPFKYKVNQGEQSITEYTMVLRVAELYLIRAEAYCRQSQFDLANEDLNKLRFRANLPVIELSTEEDLLEEIEYQRRYELFAEAGDRWIDLRRTSRLNDIMAIVKAPDWQSTDQFYPIPQVDIDRNKNLSQNPGY